MNATAAQLLLNTEEQLQFTSLEIEDVAKRSEACITIILKAIEQLKTLVILNNLSENEIVEKGKTITLR